MMPCEQSESGRGLNADIAALRHGDHLCMVYDCAADQMAAALPFVGQGLARGERCVYVADDRTVEQVAAALEAAGVDVEGEVERGALSLMTKRDAYLRSGVFDPERMIELLTEILDRAAADGFSGFRVTGEMTWALGPEEGCDRLIEYEALLNSFFPGRRAMAICQYNRRRFPARVIRDVLRTHPIAVLGDQVCRNLYYEPPDLILRGGHDAERVEWMIGQLKDSRRTEKRLEALNFELARHRDRLDALVQERTRELELSHAQLRQAERLASIGTLAAGIGHDLGNLMLPLRERLESLTSGSLSSSQQADVKSIERAMQYLGSIVQGLRLLAQDPENGAAEALDLRDWHPDAAAVVRNALPPGVQLEVLLEPDLPRVRIGRAELTQAVFNLVQNAGAALADRRDGSVVVRGTADAGESAVRLSVEDNGPGMTDEVRRRCVEPFFTTRTRGMSTGMGLALVQGIVARAGGRLEVRSELGGGSEFTLVLPVAPQTPAPEPAAAARVLVAGARLAAFIVAALEATGLSARAVSAPGEVELVGGLLVAEADLVSAEIVGAHADAGGHAVVLGGWVKPLAGHPRVSYVEAGSPPSVLRHALRAAAAAVRATASPGAAAGLDA